MDDLKITPPLDRTDYVRRWNDLRALAGLPPKSCSQDEAIAHLKNIDDSYEGQW
jgi:hypothetical protein